MSRATDMMRARNWCLTLETLCVSLEDGSNSLAHGGLGRHLKAVPACLAERESALISLIASQHKRLTALAEQSAERQDTACLMSYTADILRRRQGRMETGHYAPRTAFAELSPRDRAGGVS